MKYFIKNIICSALVIWSSMVHPSHYAGKLPVGVYGGAALERYCNENPGAPECIDAE